MITNKLDLHVMRASELSTGFWVLGKTGQRSTLRLGLRSLRRLRAWFWVYIRV